MCRANDTSMLVISRNLIALARNRAIRNSLPFSARCNAMESSRREKRSVSHPEKICPPTIDDNAPTSLDDDRLPVEVRLGLDEVAAATEATLRSESRKEPSDHDLWALACTVYDARRRRNRVFNEQLFGEPAWDMLLALYCLPKRGIVLGVTSLAHAANVPPATGHRWQKTLIDEGLIERGPLVSDSRQQLVRLTDRARVLMQRYLTRLFHCEGLGPTRMD